MPRTLGSATREYWLGDASKRPLGTFEILEWLTSLPEKFGKENGFPAGVNFVSFSFGYDAAQIFNGMPYKKVLEITRKKKFGTNERIRGSTFVGDYAIDYLKKMHLRIWRLRDGNNPYKEVIDSKGNIKRELDSVAYIEIADVFGFYQASFVEATRSLIKAGYITAEDHAIITREKDKRPDFANVPFEEIKHYCGLELDTLSKALTVNRDGFDRLGIRLPHWTGAGAAAGAFIRANGIPEHYSPDIAPDNLSLQQTRAHHAYFGGRIELMKQGYAKDREMFVYDIASAYPAGMAELPSMKDGTWEHGGNLHPLDVSMRDNMLSMFRVRWKFPDVDTDGRRIPFYPWPYRVRKKGQILFPSCGEAWLMRDEVLAGITWARKFLPTRQIVKCIAISEWSKFYPGNDTKPYAMVPELYQKRKELKDEGDITEKNYKLTYNSIYGKTVQGVGEPGEVPSCACPYYGAAATAFCRARLLRAALIDPHAIVSFMTDGIVSTHELKGLERVKPEGAENIVLGDWETRRVTGGFFLMSGMYALIEEDDTVKTKKTRGFNPLHFICRKGVLEFFTEDVLSVWRKPLIMDIAKGVPVIPDLHFLIRHYVTAGEACASPKRFELIGRWADRLRAVNVHTPGTKRTFDGLPSWAYFTPSGLKVPKIGELKSKAELLDIPAREIRECLKAGEALRCRYLIPAPPAENPTSGVLSAPSVPDWLAGTEGMGVSSLDEDEEKAAFSFFADEDRDSAEIMAG